MLSANLKLICRFIVLLTSFFQTESSTGAHHIDLPSFHTWTALFIHKCCFMFASYCYHARKKRSKGFPPTVALHHLWRSKGLFVLTRHRNILQRKRRRRHRGRASQQVKLGIDRSINSIRNTLALHCINAETVWPREKQCTYPMHSVCESTGVKCM